MYPANGLGVSGAEGTDVHAHSLLLRGLENTHKKPRCHRQRRCTHSQRHSRVGVKGILLDPLPGRFLVKDALSSLVSRKRFIECLIES